MRKNTRPVFSVSMSLKEVLWCFSVVSETGQDGRDRAPGWPRRNTVSKFSKAWGSLSIPAFPVKLDCIPESQAGQMRTERHSRSCHLQSHRISKKHESTFKPSVLTLCYLLAWTLLNSAQTCTSILIDKGGFELVFQQQRREKFINAQVQRLHLSQVCIPTQTWHPAKLSGRRADVREEAHRNGKKDPRIKNWFAHKSKKYYAILLTIYIYVYMTK